ncbi:RNA polymerase sigma-70 factor [Desertivirga arenae]|uniref:RNA polymerase sigma-70 factor n=1 Tax=Desertivirga arenae TaxID=2810309 RepID=UPI001A96AC32|nr:RNA polymerase sigma-70 factor [Pedobacter sp. SYSU D00823]
MSDYNRVSDSSLLSCIAIDDHRAFEEIYRRYWKKMLKISWNHTKDTDASKDIVHEVFLSLWQRRASLEIKDLPAFLATSVKFSVFKHYQREQRRSALARENYQPETLTQDESKLDALFLEEFINGIVEQLPERCQLVFKYSRIYGMKNSEIAEKLSISEKGVEANLTRALKIIRHELKNAGLLGLAIYYISDLFN